jgi:NAD(P)-dependent dehydrogenase (short-subunit alcohol dehydrogenase family)
MSEPLAGRVAVVAGASSGIGHATAALLVARGMQVHAFARRAPEVAGAKGLACDVTDRAAVHLALKLIERVDALVYCAGTNLPKRRLGELTPEAWDTLVAANLTGAFNLVRAALAKLRASRGDIVIVSSVSARWPDGSGPAYQAAKGGLSSFAHAIALEERPQGIRVCAIEPGAVDTPLLDKRPQPPDAATRAQMLRPHDLAETIAFVLALPKRVAIPELVILPAALQTLGKTS